MLELHRQMLIENHMLLLPATGRPKFIATIGFICRSIESLFELL